MLEVDPPVLSPLCVTPSRRRAQASVYSKIDHVRVLFATHADDAQAGILLRDVSPLPGWAKLKGGGARQCVVYTSTNDLLFEETHPFVIQAFDCLFFGAR